MSAPLDIYIADIDFAYQPTAQRFVLAPTLPEATKLFDEWLSRPETRQGVLLAVRKMEGVLWI